jgi:NAD-dependent deacetylase
MLQLFDRTHGRHSHPSSCERWPMPDLPVFKQDTLLTNEIRARLVMPSGQRPRPYVQYCDEWYDKFHFRAEPAIARDCDLLLIVGTLAAIRLSLQCAAAAIDAGTAVIDINPNANPFANE